MMRTILVCNDGRALGYVPWCELRAWLRARGLCATTIAAVDALLARGCSPAINIRDAGVVACAVVPLARGGTA